MYSIQDLDREIEKAVAARTERFHKSWLVKLIQDAHPDIRGKDADFARSAAGYWIAARVTQFFMNSKAQESAAETPEQLRFPGYEYLQRRYSVEHKGQQWIIPVEEMTDAELDRKIAEHVAQAGGHNAHAFELRRFKDERPRRKDAV